MRGVVAVLALHAPRVVAASTLVDTLWEDDPPASATNAVQVYISTIRRALREAGAAEPRRLLSSGPAGYELAVDPEAVDVTRFERLVLEGTRALDEGDLAVADRTLTAALDVWAGDRALADVEETFVDPIRTRLDELRVMAQERSIDVRLALGATDELIAPLEALVTLHPYRETLWERLMLALYRSGRQRDALQVTQRLRHLLVEDLGIAPSPAIVALESAMLRQDDDLVAPPRRPMGRASGSLVGDAQPKPLEPPRTILGLTSPPGSLVGRDEDLAELHDLVRSDTRIITLTGPGGVGKTRLSVALATAALPDFDLVAFVDLASATGADDLAPACAATLRVAAGADAVAAIAEHMTSSRALLVLDNLEQMRGAAQAVGSLAVRVPSLTLVVTSRSPLRLAAEHEHRVRPLALGDAQALFVARAQTQNAFGDDRASRRLQQICQRLDCLPLALELAAARARLLGLDGLHERLDQHGFVALGRGAADTPDRHQSLGATIAWSVDLLDEPVRGVYEALGCFHGSATLDAVEAVVHADDSLAVMEALDVLVDASLLPPPNLDGDAPRFRLLETIRHDARTRVETRPDAAQLHRRHAQHYAGVLARGGRLAVDDLADLRAAVEWLRANGDPEGAVRLAIDGRRVWFDAGALTEMRDMYAQMAELTVQAGTRARVVILTECISYVIGRLRETDPLESALGTLREAEDYDPIAINALCYLGSMALDGGDLAAADERATQAVEWARRAADVDGESMALDFSAYVARNRGDFARAAEVMSRAVEIARDHAAPADLAQRLASLSLALSAIDAQRAAERTAREALQLARTARAGPPERDALVALGVAVGAADPPAAVGHLAKATAMSFEFGQEGLEELTRFAQALLLAGDAERAALITGAASARRQAAAIDSPECAQIRAELASRLDPRLVARGAQLEPRALEELVSEHLAANGSVHQPRSY